MTKNLPTVRTKNERRTFIAYDGEYQIDATTEVPARSYKTKLEAYNAALDSIMPDEGRIKISTHYEDI